MLSNEKIYFVSINFLLFSCSLIYSEICSDIQLFSDLTNLHLANFWTFPTRPLSICQFHLIRINDRNAKLDS